MAKQNVELKFSLKDGVSAGLANIRKGVDSVTKQLGKTVIAAGAAGTALATIGGAAAIKEGIAAAGAFEQAIVDAGRASNATADELDAMGRAALKASSDTGLTANQAAEALEALGRSGLSANDAIGALVPTLALAKAEKISVAEAASRTADTLDQFGLAASKTAGIVDKLSATASKNGTSFVQVTDALAQAGPAARTAGEEFETTAAAIGLLARNGIEGGKAGSALRGIFEALADPTSKFSAALTDAGIKSRDFGTVIAELGTKGAKGEAAIQSLGARGTAALQVLLREGGGALQSLTTELGKVDGAAKAAADKVGDTLPGAIADLKNEIVNAGIGFFTPITDPLKEALQDAADAIEAFAKSEDFATLQESFRVTFVEGATAVRALIAEIDFKKSVAEITDFVDSTSKTFARLSESVDKVVTAFNLLESAVMVVPDSLNAAADIASGAAAKLAAGVSIPLGLISEDAEAARQAVDRFGNEALADAAQSATDFGNDMIAAGNAVVGLDREVKTTDNTVTRAARSIADFAKKTFESARAALEASPAFKRFRESIADTGKAAFEAAPGFSSLGQELIAVEGAIATALANGASRDAVEGMVQRAKDLKAAIDEAAAAAEKAKPKLKDAGDTGAKAFTGAAEAAKETATAVEDATESTSRAANAAEAGAASIATVVAGLYSAFAETSRGAAELFAELQKGANFGSIGLESYGKALVAADQGTQRAIASAKQFGENSVAAFNDFAESGTIAGNEAAGAFFKTEGALDAVEQAIKNGVGAFGLMDSQTLSNVQAALDRARSKVRALEDQARSATASLAQMGDQLQDAADQAAGDEEAIARRAFERKVKEIAELAKLAGAAGASEAARVERLAREEFDRAIARINAEKAARIDASRDVADARITDEQRVQSVTGGAGAGLAPQLNQGQGPGPAPVRDTSNIAQTINVAVNTDFINPRTAADKEALGRIVATEIERILRRKR